MSEVEDRICAQIQSRAAVGLKKYGVPINSGGLSEVQLLQHALEEVLDFSVYLQQLIDEKTKNKD